MNPKEGEKMTDNEFLIYLNALTISEEYDDAYFKKLFQALFMFFEPDSISNDIFKRDGELVSKNDAALGEDDIIFTISSISSHIIIRNPRKKLENKEFTIKFIQTILNNIFENKKIQDRLKLDKYMDPLLSVYNRSAYTDLLDSKKPFQSTGVAFVDVNGLGVENNMYGHEAGDLMLQTIAKCLKNKFRLKDIYRIGGDEFLIICNNIDEEHFQDKLDELQELVNLTEYSISLGFIYRERIDDLKEAVDEANILMKANKEKFRKEHPEKYLNKYDVTYVGKKGTSLHSN